MTNWVRLSERPSFISQTQQAHQQTAESNHESCLPAVLCVAIAIVIALLITTVGLVVSIAYYQKRNQDDAAGPSSPADSSPDKTGSSSSPDVKSASPSSRGRLLPSHVGLANLKLVTSLKGHKAEDLVKLV